MRKTITTTIFTLLAVLAAGGAAFGQDLDQLLVTALGPTGNVVELRTTSGVTEDDMLWINGETFMIEEVMSTTRLRVTRGDGARRYHAPGSRVYGGSVFFFNSDRPVNAMCQPDDGPHFDANGRTIWDCVAGTWSPRGASDVLAPTLLGYGARIAREDFNQRGAVFQNDGTALSLADTTVNYVFSSPLGTITYREELAKTVSSWNVFDGRLDLDGDNTDNEGVEILWGGAETNGIIEARETAACISAGVYIGDISDVDDLLVGWRNDAAFDDGADYDAYTQFNWIGVHSGTADLRSSQEISEATDNDDSGVNWGDNQSRGLRVCIDLDGYPHAYYTASYAREGTPGPWIAAPMGATQSRYPDSTDLVPALIFKTDGTSIAEVEWVELTYLRGDR